MSLIPKATMRALNEEAHAAARQARKMGDPRAADFARIARETDRLMDSSAPVIAPVIGANVGAVA